MPALALRFHLHPILFSAFSRLLLFWSEKLLPLGKRFRPRRDLTDPSHTKAWVVPLNSAFYAEVHSEWTQVLAMYPSPRSWGNQLPNHFGGSGTEGSSWCGLCNTPMCYDPLDNEDFVICLEQVSNPFTVGFFKG